MSTSKRNRRGIAAIIASGALGAALLSLTMTGTLSGFTASITGANNSVATGALTLQEQSTGGTPATCNSTDGGSASVNSATCTSINKFGGATNLVPGGAPVVTSVTLKNTGTIAAKTIALIPGANCQQTTSGPVNGNAGDLCSKINVIITSGGTQVFNGTAAALAGAQAGAFNMPSAPAAGASVPFTFSVSLDSSAGNAYQGLAASLPLTWSIAS